MRNSGMWSLQDGESPRTGQLLITLGYLLHICLISNPWDEIISTRHARCHGTLCNGGGIRAE